MAQGDGSISKLGRERWRIQLSLGRDPLTGKYKRVTQVITGTKADARKALVELRKKKDNGVQLDKGKTTFSEMAALWLAAKETAGACSAQKLQGYKTELGYLSAYIGNAKVQEIDVRIIESVLARIRAERGLSGATMRRIYGLAKSVFEKAIDYEILQRNPCRGVQAPKADPVERRSLTLAEVKTLRHGLDAEYSQTAARLDGVAERQAARGNYSIQNVNGLFKLSCCAAVRVILATGLRRGEAFALVWGNIDTANGSIAVRHSLTAQGEIKQPKSKAGNRNLAIDPETAQFLAQWKTQQARYLRRLGIIQGNATPVACSNIGGYVNLDNVRRFWDKLRKSCGLDGIGLHSLRHTQATQLLANGADLKMVQARLGHSSASLTLGTYAHAVPENDGKAAQIIGELLGGENQKTA